MSIFERSNATERFLTKAKAMATILDKNTVKEALRELIMEEPDTFKALLKEILIEEQNHNIDEEFDQLLQKNFKRFDETFRALA